jgi:hypothetical protein
MQQQVAQEGLQTQLAEQNRRMLWCKDICPARAQLLSRAAARHSKAALHAVWCGCWAAEPGILITGMEMLSHSTPAAVAPCKLDQHILMLPLFLPLMVRWGLHAAGGVLADLFQ